MVVTRSRCKKNEVLQSLPIARKATRKIVPPSPTLLQVDGAFASSASFEYHIGCGKLVRLVAQKHSDPNGTHVDSHGHVKGLWEYDDDYQDTVGDVLFSSYNDPESTKDFAFAYGLLGATKLSLHKVENVKFRGAGLYDATATQLAVIGERQNMPPLSVNPRCQTMTVFQDRIYLCDDETRTLYRAAFKSPTCVFWMRPIEYPRGCIHRPIFMGHTLYALGTAPKNGCTMHTFDMRRVAKNKFCSQEFCNGIAPDARTLAFIRRVQSKIKYLCADDAEYTYTPIVTSWSVE